MGLRREARVTEPEVVDTVTPEDRRGCVELRVPHGGEVAIDRSTGTTIGRGDDDDPMPEVGEASDGRATEDRLIVGMRSDHRHGAHRSTLRGTRDQRSRHQR